MNALLDVVAGQINEERRRRNNLLLKVVKGDEVIYNGEDLMRLVGELQCAYNHCIAAQAGDGDIYCLLKHLSSAIILSGEVDGDAAELYQIMDALTNGVIAACKACHDEEE